MQVYDSKSLEVLYVLTNVVHHFVIAAGGVDFWNNTRCQFVHQFAQQNTVPESELKR